MNRPVVLAATAVLALASSPRTASAEVADAESVLTAAEDAFLDVEYERALAELDRVEGLEGVTDDQMARIHALQGTIFFLTGQEARARATFARLVRLAPGFTLPEEYPPRAAEFLDEVRAEAPEAPEVEHRPPGFFTQGQPLEITADVRNVTDAHGVRLYYRRRGERRYSSVSMARTSGDEHVGTVPAFGAFGADEAGALEYFVVVSLEGERVANAGSPRRPFEIVVGGATEDDSEGGRRAGGVASRWWFWLAIGAAAAVAAGTGVALWYFLGSEDENGSVGITLRFAQQ